MSKRKRNKGDKYRPVVTIERVRKGKPTVLRISGDRYILDGSTRAVSKKKWKDRTNWKDG